MSLTFLSASERKQFFFYFNCDALERADKKTRFESWAIARQNGWMNANQIIAAEGQNSVPDGDVFLVNGTMIPLDVAKNKSLTDVAPDAITTEEDSNDEA